MQYKCDICHNSFDEIFFLRICYVCNLLICENHAHTHNYIDNSDYDHIKDIIRTKTDNKEILNLLQIDILGYPLNYNVQDLDHDKVDENRAILKPYRYANMELNLHYQTFIKNLMQLQSKFLYKFYVNYLRKKICHDISFYILSFI